MSSTCYFNCHPVLPKRTSPLLSILCWGPLGLWGKPLGGIRPLAIRGRFYQLVRWAIFQQIRDDLGRHQRRPFGVATQIHFSRGTCGRWVATTHIFLLFVAQLPLLGLSVQPSKCVAWSSFGREAFAVLPQGVIYASDGIRLLGLPLGTHDYVGGFLSSALEEERRVILMLNRQSIIALEHIL